MGEAVLSSDSKKPCAEAEVGTDCSFLLPPSSFPRQMSSQEGIGSFHSIESPTRDSRKRYVGNRGGAQSWNCTLCESPLVVILPRVNSPNHARIS